MKMSKILLAAATFVLLSGPLSAHANIIYNWTGTCQPVVPAGRFPTGCTGQASLHVVTTNAYTPGELSEFNPSVLLEAIYSDSTITTADLGSRYALDGFAFLLPTSLPNSSGPLVFGGGGGFELQADFFRSDVNGVWKFEGEGLRPNCDRGIDNICAYLAIGIDGVWTRVPEPSTLALLGVALAGLVFYRRRGLR